MDICIQIIIDPPTHDLSYDPAKEGRRIVQGDVIDVYLAEVIGTWNGSDYIPNEPVSSPRTGFVFITDVPDRPIEAIKRKFTEEATSILDPSQILLRRRHGVRVTDIPISVRNQMIADRYITFNWTQVKNYFRNKQEDRLVTDVDLG